MQKRLQKGARLALSVATLSGIGLIGAFGASTAGAASSSTVIGHVYLDDNTAGTNTISGFDRHLDGSLTPLAGSPFIAGGAGTGAGLASQGALQLSSDGPKTRAGLKHPPAAARAANDAPMASGAKADLLVPVAVYSVRPRA